jgi:hypothetical protein
MVSLNSGPFSIGCRTYRRGGEHMRFAKYFVAVLVPFSSVLEGAIVLLRSLQY